MNESRERPRQIRKFNPGTFQSDEEVISQFVVRSGELGIVLDVLRGNIESPSCQHVLLVAPRGRGKTMLLARVAAELRADDEFSERLLPVRFMEESQEIFDMGDFWLESLYYLAREQAVRDSDLSRELRDVHGALAAEWRGRELEDRARAAVLETADRLGRQLVLMVENLQSLCGAVDDDFGWKLRKVLQSEPQIILLASATSRFRELDDAQHAFFELFRIVRLEPLDTRECQRLWHMVSGDEVSEREIRPLQILTGGSPRLLIIIGDFAKHRSLRQLMEELVKLVDDHTEYFRGHLEVFAKTERRVYLAVIDLWQPSTTGEVAARTRMDVRAVSALLGRLVERGAVIVEGSGKKRMYAAAERLYSIYYKLRRERDEAAVVRNLIHFMALFYNEIEMDEWSRALMSEAMQWPALREGIRRATAESSHVGRVFAGEEWRSIEQVSDGTTALDYERANRILDQVAVATDKGEFQRLVSIADQFFASLRDGARTAPESVFARILNVKGYAHEKLGDFDSALASCEEVVERFGTTNEPELQAQVAMSLANKGVVLTQLGKTESAIATFNEIVERFGTSDPPKIQLLLSTALVGKGEMHGRLGQFQSELAAYDEVIHRFGTSAIPGLQAAVATALACKAISQEQRGETRAAIDLCDEVVKRFEGSSVPEIRTQVAIALWVKTKVLLSQRERFPVMQTFRAMYSAIVPGQPELVRLLLECVPDLIAIGISERELVEVLSSDRMKADTIVPLVVALRQRTGETVRAPAEVLEVAADIGKQIEAKTRTGDTAVPAAPST